jgi:UTP--glucose-1-phosphate uridylyltransferase
MPISKAVIPAAGLGTRFLPATKAMPKEMLPVVDKPAIQYVVEEAVDAGLTDVLMVTGRNKNALENHFDRNTELETALERKGDNRRLKEVNQSSHLASIHYVRQGDPKGLGHAVSRAEMHVGNNPFAVLLGDDIIDSRDDLLKQMVLVYEKQPASILALMEVDPSQVHLYGIATVEPTNDDSVVRITELVEKPKADVFAEIAKTEPGSGGEIQLTDALNALAHSGAGGGVLGVIFRGRRYDTGDRMDYLKAIVQVASDREDLGPGFTAWLKGFVGGLEKE